MTIQLLIQFIKHFINSGCWFVITTLQTSPYGRDAIAELDWKVERFQNQHPKLIAVGEKGEAILGGSTTVRVNCINIAPGPETPTWDISVESPAPLLGGAVVPGRLYLLLSDGLYALESQETQP